MQAIYNKIFVKIDKRLNDEIKTESGLVLYKDPTFDEEWNVTTIGKAVSIPVRYWKPDGQEFISNVQEGDTVVFNYLVTLDLDNLIVFEGQQYWLCDYYQVIAVIRDGKALPTGIHILIEPIENQIKSSLLEIPEGFGKSMSTRGIVHASNDPNIPVGAMVEYEEQGQYEQEFALIEDGKPVTKKLFAMYNENIHFIYEKVEQGREEITSAVS